MLLLHRQMKKTITGDMGMLSIAVCDDDSVDRNALKEFIDDFFTARFYEYTVTEYMSGQALADDIAEGYVSFQLIFMDIYMDSELGIEAARRIRQHDRQAAIIFFSTTPQFALESYDVRAFGYLLKPLCAARAETLLEHFLTEEWEKGQRTLFLKEGIKGLRLGYREIEYIESSRNVLLIHTKNGGLHKIYARIGSLEEELSGHGFLRCHQSFIINMDCVSTADKSFRLESGTVIPISQRKTKLMRDLYFAYILEKADVTKL